jgi:hypothetical protein
MAEKTRKGQLSINGVSEKKLASCRENAKNSTGPKTEEGKAVVARNAIKHGVLCDTLLPGEEPEDFAAYACDLKVALTPEGAVETMLIERIVSLSWRLRRVFLAEQGALAGEYHVVREKQAMARVSQASRTALDDLLMENARNEIRILDTKKYTEAKADEEDAQRWADTDLTRFARAFEGAQPFLDRLTRYERTIERSLFMTLKELERVQAVRKLPVNQNVRMQVGMALNKFVDELAAGISAKQTEENAS